jgi:hypothetical protein
MKKSFCGNVRGHLFIRSGERAQGAMEYFITYSWMMIVLVVVVGALYALGLTNPSNYTTKFATGNFAFTLGQATSSPIYVTAIGCNTISSTGNMMTYNVFLPIGSNMTTYLQCYSGSTPFSGTVGTIFNGYLIVNYTNINTGLGQTVISALTQKVASSKLHP